jgi:hypothetical protein
MAKVDLPHQTGANATGAYAFKRVVAGLSK